MLNSYGAVDWGGAVFTSPLDPPKVRYLTVGTPRANTEVRLERLEVFDHLLMLSGTKVDKQALQSDIAEKLGRGL